MTLATGLPLSTASVTTTAVAVVKTIAPNVTKDSNSGSNSFSVVTNTKYNFNSLLNANVTASIIPVANTKTVLPTVEWVYNIGSGGDGLGSKQTAYMNYANTKVIINNQYNIGAYSPNNYIIPTSVNFVANTKTVLPTVEWLYTVGNNNGLQQYANSVVVTNVSYVLGQFSPNNYIIPTSTNFVANSKTVLPTVEWLYTVGNNNGLQQYANTTVVTNNLYTIGTQTNQLIKTNINFVANTQTTINALAVQGQVLRSVIVPTLSSNIFNFYIGTYTPIVNTLVSTSTINDFPSKPYTIKNAYSIVTNNVVVYGANTGSNAAPGMTYVPAYSTTINDFPSKPYTIKNAYSVVTNNVVVYGANTGSNAAPGMTYVTATSVTINDFPTKPYNATGFASSVTFKYIPMATIVYNTSSNYWLNGLKIDTQAYANSIYLIKSGFATSVTNYYGTGGGFDPNSPYLGASTAYWS